MILEYLKLSVNELWNNKLRSFLSLIGIVIGVAVVFIILSISDIANVAITSQITGSNGVVNINYIKDRTNKENILMSSFMSNAGGSGEKNYKFNYDDINELNKIEGVVDSLAHYSSYVKASVGRKTSNLNVKRNNDNFIKFYDIQLTAGKFIEDYPTDKQINLTIISEKFITDVLELTPEEALGKTVKINNRLFTICGIFTSNNDSFKLANIISKEAYDGLFSSGTIQFMAIKVKPGADVGETTNKAVTKLNELHNTTNTKEGFKEEDLSVIINQIKTVTGILSLIMSIIASISLLVAGIGVMNIMLVSVVERTREIGVKRALGASKKAIQFQFIVESSLLTLIGGLIGILIGIGVIKIALVLLKMNLPLNIFYIIFAAGFSISLGVIFGYLPAKRAANLNIIEAIQSE